MLNKRILIIENDEKSWTLVSKTLEAEGYRIDIALSGSEGLEILRTQPSSLVLLDLYLSDMRGFDLCKLLKQEEQFRHIPIIIVSDKSNEVDIVTGLELGADDFIIKPINHRILLGRIRAILRRVPSNAVSIRNSIELNDLIIDPSRHEVSIKDKKIQLTPTEFRILYLLAKDAGQVFRRLEIIKLLRGNNHSASERAIDVQIAGLRRKLGMWGKRIETVRGVGYRIRANH